jgi:enterochelin esterase family protein
MSPREEAAPTFVTWKQRLQAEPAAARLACWLSRWLPAPWGRLLGGDRERQRTVEQFLDMLQVIGTPMIEAPCVHFVFYGPQARRVLVTGEFNEWGEQPMALSPLGQTGFFCHTMTVNGPVRLEYKFVVDGVWQLDPLCPNAIDNGLGDQNSYFVVGDMQAPPELEWVAELPHGRVEEFDFESALLNNQRRVYVALPPGYDDNDVMRFPVLYVHDGGEYLSRARLPTILDNLLARQEVPPLIAVMVDPVDRVQEYGVNEAYARFVEEELVPAIDQRYRTVSTREARGVMGASLGGLISTYLGLTRPHLFSKVGGQSSAFYSDTETLTTLARQLPEPLQFYFDVGVYEPQFIPAHHDIIPLLEARDCPCLYQELPGGHNWSSWRAHLKELLIFLWHTP